MRILQTDSIFWLDTGNLMQHKNSSWVITDPKKKMRRKINATPHLDNRLEATDVKDWSEKSLQLLMFFLLLHISFLR